MYVCRLVPYVCRYVPFEIGTHWHIGSVGFHGRSEKSFPRSRLKFSSPLSLLDLNAWVEVRE